MNNTVVICAHPDDAVIFCGGSIIKEISSQKSSVSVISLTGPNSTAEENEINKYSDSSGCSFDTLGYKSTSGLDHKKIVKQISNILIDLLPTKILTHWHNDTHYGHIATYQIVSESLAPYVIKTGGEIKTNFYCFDTYLSWGRNRSIFPVSQFVDITNEWEEKLNQIKIFNNPYQKRWINMTEATNNINGKRCGVEFAEAFLLQSNFCGLGGGERAFPSLP